MKQCLSYPGYKQRDGYGVRKYKGKVVFAHRLAYAEHHNLDVLTMGGTVMHSCDNPACIEPEHLLMGTQKLNSDDKFQKGRQASKLTQEQADTIRSRFKAGVSGFGGHPGNSKILSAEYGVAECTIRDIAAGRAWMRVHSST